SSLRPDSHAILELVGGEEDHGFTGCKSFDDLRLGRAALTHDHFAKRCAFPFYCKDRPDLAVPEERGGGDFHDIRGLPDHDVSFDPVLVTQCVWWIEEVTDHIHPLLL